MPKAKVAKASSSGDTGSGIGSKKTTGSLGIKKSSKTLRSTTPDVAPKKSKSDVAPKKSKSDVAPKKSKKEATPQQEEGAVSEKADVVHGSGFAAALQKALKKPVGAEAALPSAAAAAAVAAAAAAAAAAATSSGRLSGSVLQQLPPKQMQKIKREFNEQVPTALLFSTILLRYSRCFCAA